MHQLHVEGMSCNHCVSVITKALKEADANAEVSVDLGHKEVRVESPLPLERVKSVIANAGYQVV